MASFKYTLRITKIQITFSYGRDKLFRVSTGFEVKDSKHWNASGQKVKELLDEPNAVSVNKSLSYLKAHFEDEYQNKLTQGRAIDNSLLKEIFNEYENSASVTNKLVSKGFIELFGSFIEDSKNMRKRGRKLSEGTIKTYKTTKVVFEDYEKEKGEILFRNLDESFYNSFVDYCEARELSMNYIGKIIKNFKTFINYAVDYHDVELSKKYDSKKYTVPKEEVDHVYLNNEELMKLYHLDLSALGENYERARDLFLIGAFTGLRVSDFNRLTMKNVVELEGVKFFKIEAQKTKTEIIIPLASVVEDIIMRNNGLPRYMPDQTINKLIKEVGASAGIDELVILRKTIGGKQKEKPYMKYELIQTHTARRSFCTNAYLGGMDTLLIMAVSGHKAGENFIKYVKVTKEQQAQRIAQHPYFQELKSTNYDKQGKSIMKAV